jgi:hypothetical protein
MGPGGEGLGGGECWVVSEEFGFKGREGEEVFFFVFGVVAAALEEEEG